MSDISSRQGKFSFGIPPDETAKVKEPKKSKSKSFCDLDPSKWREYTDVELGSLWLFGARERGNGHKLDYHGNFIPQIVSRLLTRYSKQGDVVLDLFLGSGTTAIESQNMGRRCIGVELKPELALSVRDKIDEPYLDRDIIILQGDSTRKKTADRVQASIEKMDRSHAQLLILHPPYWDIISFSESSADISNEATLAKFLSKFKRVAKNGYDLLEPGRFAGLVIGDKYSAGELIPLGFLTMKVMTDLGFRVKSIIVKNIEGNEIGKGKTNNLWRYRALAGGFYIFKHEYIIIFQKPG